MEKCTLNQQTLPKEKERTSKYDVHTLSRPGQAVSTTYKIFGHREPRGLCQKWKKNTAKSTKIAQRTGKRHPSMMSIPCPDQVKLSPPCTENSGIGSPGVSAKMEKCDLNQQKLPRERERDTQIWCPYLVQTNSNFLHHTQKIWA